MHFTITNITLQIQTLIYSNCIFCNRQKDECAIFRAISSCIFSPDEKFAKPAPLLKKDSC